MIVKARITTKFSNHGYAPREIKTVENFFVDSAMDTDADTFTIGVGDPYHELTEVLNRDNEVRCTLFASKDGTLVNLHTGFCDEISLDENNVLQFSGRDLTAVAADSQHPYGSFRLVRPHVFVADEAKKLGIGSSLALANVPMFQRFNVDGSESYWEVWYRLYRKRQMWIWADADGTITANTLNFARTPKYVFGETETDRELKVERVEWRSNKKQRIWEVHVFGSRGDITFTSTPPARDVSISDWIKKPVMMLNSSTARSPQQAREEAIEEIFESQVGALEIKLLVGNPGFLIQQNSMARVRLPTIGLEGDFYIVGVKSIGSMEDGLRQEVRLREKNFALSKRVPDPPIIGIGGVAETPSEQDQFGPGGVAAGIGANLGGIRWRYHFVEAANKYHGPWPFYLFLGVLLSIADVESGFRNVRNASPTNEYPGSVGHVPSMITEPAAFRKFASEFGNEKRYGRVDRDYAVGPMQLLSVTPKEFADELGGSQPDELGGGRWEPRWNIISGASWVRSKLKISGIEGALRGGNAYDIIWQGLAGYTGETWPNAPIVRRYKEAFDARYREGILQAIKDAPENVSAAQGARAVVENIFKWWDVLVANESRVHYSQDRPTQPLANKEKPPNFPISLDCSGAVEYTNWLGGGKPLDNGGHRGMSSTYSLDNFGRVIQEGQMNTYAQGGFLVLVFYDDPAHVVAVKSSREVYSHGQESGPNKYDTIHYRTVSQIRAYEVT